MTADANLIELFEITSNHGEEIELFKISSNLIHKRNQAE